MAGFFSVRDDTPIADFYRLKSAMSQCKTCTRPEYEVAYQPREAPRFRLLRCPANQYTGSLGGPCPSYEMTPGITKLWE